MYVHINFESKSKNVPLPKSLSVALPEYVCVCEKESETEKHIQIINKWIDETCFSKELFLIMAKLKDIYIQSRASGTFCDEYYILIDTHTLTFT